MAYSTSFLYGAPYNAYSQEDAFQDYTSQRLDEAQFDVAMNNIDPSLHGVSPTVPFASSWSPIMMQRFQKESQKLALFNPIPSMQAMAHQNIVRPVPPVPPPSQGRHGSPVSSHEPSSSCSSAQSPPGSEFYTDNGPSTPPDMAVLSPFQTSRVDQWDSSSQYFQLAGMRAFPNETCVSMAQINPAQDLYHEFEPQSPMNLSLNRSSTYGSQSSSAFEADTVNAPTPMDFSIKRMSSPEDMHPVVKDEIHIVLPVPSNKASRSEYPPIGSDDDEDPEEDQNAIIPKVEDDDDDDYEPANKRHRRTNSNNTRRGPKTKRAAAPRSIEKAAPKRQKTGGASSPPPKILPPSPPGSKGSLHCRECSLTFKDQTGFDGHVKKQHTRPFVCVFNFAGCDSTFASKNEWKRHVSSQHLLLHYWLCDQESCAHTKNGPPSPSVAPQTTSNKRSRGRAQEESINVAPQLPNGAIFNRKDLYTQHLRRMHTPLHIKKAVKAGKKSSGSGAHPDWDEHIRVLQQSAVQERCQLPTHMTCPAPGCKQAFNGADAWDQRMEHVARHLEKAANGQEQSVVFGGPTDATLMQWCTNPSVGVVKRAANGKWELNNPLKPEGGKDQRQTASTNSDPLIKNEIVVESGGEEDAEGEDE